MVSALLVFYVERQNGSSSGPAYVTLHRLLAPWVEGKDGANVVRKRWSNSCSGFACGCLREKADLFEVVRCPRDTVLTLVDEYSLEVKASWPRVERRGCTRITRSRQHGAVPAGTFRQRNKAALDRLKKVGSRGQENESCRRCIDFVWFRLKVDFRGAAGRRPGNAS